jgi:hypothetical protein
LEVVDLGQGVRRAAQLGMADHVGDALAVDPDLTSPAAAIDDVGQSVTPRPSRRQAERSSPIHVRRSASRMAISGAVFAFTGAPAPSRPEFV